MERVVAEHVHRALIFYKNKVWIQASGVIIRVMREMVKARALRGIRAVIIFVVELGVVFLLSVAIVFFIVDVHT